MKIKLVEGQGIIGVSTTISMFEGQEIQNAIERINKEYLNSSKETEVKENLSLSDKIYKLLYKGRKQIIPDVELLLTVASNLAIDIPSSAEVRESLMKTEIIH